MFRRHLLALGAVSAVGAAVVGELVELPGPAPVSLPSQLSYDHVRQVRDLTRRLGEAGNTCVAGPAVLSVAAASAEQLLGVSGAELVRRALRVAVAELHIEAGWAWFDAGCYDRAVHHFTTALKLAIEARDAYLQSIALKYAGMATVEHGHPDDGLKMLQPSRGRFFALGVLAESAPDRHVFRLLVLLALHGRFDGTADGMTVATPHITHPTSSLSATPLATSRG